MNLSEQRAAALTTILANSAEGFGGLLRCETCRRTQSIGPGDASFNMRHGWPKCCGYTMRWWTRRQIDAGEMPFRYEEAKNQ